MNLQMLNPFRIAPIEHLATVRELETYLGKQASLLRQQLKVLRTTTKNIYAIAQAESELARLESACLEAYTCDPWAYEPVLLDTLVRAKETHEKPEKIQELRALIRAGSWMHYQRHDEQDILERIRQLRRHLPAHAEALQQAAHAYIDHVVGEALEPAVRLIEDLDLRAWLSLKKLAHIHGVSVTDESVHLRTMRQELEHIRAIRDAFYFRRLYPEIANKGFKK